MPASLKLVSVNIERSKHLELVIPFLQKQDPDIVCMQELMEYDIPRIERELGMRHRYVKEKLDRVDGQPCVEGIGIFSRVSFLNSSISYYVGGAEHMVMRDMSDIHTKHATQSSAVLFCDVEKDGERFRIATTHFTWTPTGEPDDYQRADMKRLLEILAGSGEFVLTGDFNAPRTMVDGSPGEIFAMLASKYKDNIPPQYQTSIDVTLHRAGHLPNEHMDKKMVDGLFTTPEYIASNVALHEGVSDHMAISAVITKIGSASTSLD